MHPRRGAVQFLKEAFLPEGYPDSVSKDYMPYQLFDTLQAFCSNVTGLLATRATFRRIGVGDSTATATAATLTWVLKDGIGMMSRILFAWCYSFDIDADAKQWRFYADLLNDTGTFLEVLAPSLPQTYFLILACLATIMKCLCGVAAGSTKAALSQHFAIKDNVADLNAKDGSQETVVGLIGLIFGSYIVQWITDDAQTWICFVRKHVILIIRSVVIPTLNTQRAYLLMFKYLNEGYGRVNTPQEIAKHEQIFWKNPSRIRNKTTHTDILRAYFHAVYLSFHKLQADEGYEVKVNAEFNNFLKGARDNGWIIEDEGRNRIRVGEWRWAVKERKD
ncbi:hypothetical protein HDU67_001997 [Dinochytrium kinnereticum]|nr:hypothetical protein HDU67_001997 [Dinochytrium kinnereticum]